MVRVEEQTDSEQMGDVTILSDSISFNINVAISFSSTVVPSFSLKRTFLHKNKDLKRDYFF